MIDRIAAMIRPPNELDRDRELPPGMVAGTIEHALFLEWGDHYHQFLNEQHEYHNPAFDH